MFPVLIGFEESQTIVNELRSKGIEFYSCDLLECSGGRPEWHAKAISDQWFQSSLIH